jgi:hypothetical protein
MFEVILLYFLCIYVTFFKYNIFIQVENLNLVTNFVYC